MVWPIVAAAVTAVGAISSFVGARKAEKAAEEQAALEAEYEEKITTERLRQIDVEERMLYGETLARYAGGGVRAALPQMVGGPLTTTGSPESVLQEQAREFARERDITEEVGATRVQQALKSGEAMADRYRYQGYADVASSISNIFQILG